MSQIHRSESYFRDLKNPKTNSDPSPETSGQNRSYNIDMNKISIFITEFLYWKMPKCWKINKLRFFCSHLTPFQMKPPSSKTCICALILWVSFCKKNRKSSQLLENGSFSQITVSSIMGTNGWVEILFWCCTDTSTVVIWMGSELWVITGFYLCGFFYFSSPLFFFILKLYL